MASVACAVIATFIMFAVSWSVGFTRAAPTSAIVGGLEMSLVDGPRHAPTTARLERIYSSSGSLPGPATGPVDKPGAGSRRHHGQASDSYTRTGTRVHVSANGNPAPCSVAGRHFLHGQQVTRRDPCEFCLCLDGEVFCWWQDCPPSSAQGPCRGRPAFSACQQDAASAPPTASASPSAAATSNNGTSDAGRDVAPVTPAQTQGAVLVQQLGQPASQQLQAQVPTGSPEPSPSTPSSALTGADAAMSVGLSGLSTETAAPASASSTDDHASPSTPTNTSAASPSSVTATTSTTTVSTTTELLCHVLGSTYHVGEVLPRDTGSCLQCECGHEGRVTCSPKDCLSVREEEDVYQPANSLDMFDVDSF